MILDNHKSDFEALLQNNNDVCNHHRNIPKLLIKIFKINIGFAPPIMWSVLKGRNNILTTLKIFNNFRQKEKEIYILV